MLDDDEYVGWWMMMNDAAADDDDDCDSWLWFQALIYLASCLSLFSSSIRCTDWKVLAVGTCGQQGRFRHSWRFTQDSHPRSVFFKSCLYAAYVFCIQSLLISIFIVCFAFGSFFIWVLFGVFRTGVKNLPAKFQEKGVLNNMKKNGSLVCFFFFRSHGSSSVIQG